MAETAKKGQERLMRRERDRTRHSTLTVDMRRKQERSTHGRDTQTKAGKVEKAEEER